MIRAFLFRPPVPVALVTAAFLAFTACEGKPPSPAPTPTAAPAPVTRAEAAELVVKARYGEAFEFPPEPFFTDVPADDPRFRYVQKLRAEKLTMAGVDGAPSHFGAAEAATRYMLATFLVRARFGEDFDYPKEPLFADMPEAHANFKYVQKAASEGILPGCAPGAFCPNGTLTPEGSRAVVAAAFPPKG